MHFNLSILNIGLFSMLISLHENRKEAGMPYKEVPVLCYHNINVSPSKENDFRISAFHFDQQMSALYNNGYHTILPEQLYQYLTEGVPLPANPVIVTFDDSHEEHFSIAANVLEKYHYQGVFFIMTVCIGKKNYLTPQQIKSLSDSGHAIECHTYNHPAVTKISGEQWVTQIDKSIKTLESITGKPVEYFAWPFGAWNEPAIIELKKRGIKAAFQLAEKQSKNDPLYTIRRIIVPGYWSGQELLKQIAINFRN